MLEVKKRLRCKPFKWFLQHVDKERTIGFLEDIDIAGEIKNRHKDQNLCIDLLSHTRPQEEYGVLPCHGGGIEQGFLRSR